MGMDLNTNLLRSILILGTIIEARDPYTGGHVWRVAEYSSLLAQKAGLSKDDMLKAYMCGYVHDIGKIGIPDSILNKTTSLTKEEFELIKTHTTIGGEILKAHPLSDLVMDAVVHHHERIDGKGYPDRLEGDRIDFITRIISVSDTFDAITSVRPYKDMIPSDKAIILLNGQREKRYDDKVVTLLVDAVEKKEIDSIIGHCSYSRPMSVCKMCGPVIAINLNKKDGDLILCNVCEGKYKIHANGNNFELEYLSEQKVFVKPEIDYIQIDKIIEFCK
jgi:putative nucleotidyltransferase with HDIG domain